MSSSITLGPPQGFHRVSPDLLPSQHWYTETPDQCSKCGNASLLFSRERCMSENSSSIIVMAWICPLCSERHWGQPTALNEF